jgi:hypothetical protein
MTLPQQYWDWGTAYDLFVSLVVLHNPAEFGVGGRRAGADPRCRARDTGTEPGPGGCALSLDLRPSGA